MKSRHRQSNNCIITPPPAANDVSGSSKFISSLAVYLTFAGAAAAGAANEAPPFSSTHNYLKNVKARATRRRIISSSRSTTTSENSPWHPDFAIFSRIHWKHEIFCNHSTRNYRQPTPTLAFLLPTTLAKKRQQYNIIEKNMQPCSKDYYLLRWKCQVKTDTSVPTPTSRTVLCAVHPSDSESQESEQTHRRQRQQKQQQQQQQNRDVIVIDHEKLEEQLYQERFKRRLQQSSKKQLEALSNLPPHSDDPRFEDPKNVITSVLEALQTPHIPCPFFGYEVLYGCCTGGWKGVLRRSVGVDFVLQEEHEDDRTPEKREERDEDDEEEKEIFLRALSASMERDNNQFGILVGLGTDHDHEPLSSQTQNNQNDCKNDEADTYALEFPWDTLDYYDGTAWLECRLRHARTDQLLVVLGFSLQRREEDGRWLIDKMDWQDFREKYRPGIGREEWERICG